MDLMKYKIEEGDMKIKKEMLRNLKFLIVCGMTF
jgi:hypothetical protein